MTFRKKDVDIQYRLILIIEKMLFKKVLSLHATILTSKEMDGLLEYLWFAGF